MSDPQGSTEAIKKRLITLIHTSSTWLDSNKVTGNQDDVEAYIMGENFPFCTVRLGSTRQSDVIGRNTPNSGKFIDYTFTIHLFQSACSETGKERTTYIRDICNDILDYLEGQRSSEMSNNIMDIYNLSSREARTEGASPKLLRIIINGNLLILRED